MKKQNKRIKMKVKEVITENGIKITYKDEHIMKELFGKSLVNEAKKLEVEDEDENKFTKPDPKRIITA